jgi:hypothetical protein
MPGMWYELERTFQEAGVEIGEGSTWGQMPLLAGYADPGVRQGRLVLRGRRCGASRRLCGHGPEVGAERRHSLFYT